ncbi:hypothetical protein, partial [Morganella morganii]|uniref:hypothetical protein n=1 Tax=Morganella morganii TaxID=582 RepID=UPI001FFCC827
STLAAGKSLSLTADSIELENTNIKSGELSLIAKKGDIIYSTGIRPVFTSDISALPLLHAPGGIYADAGSDITFRNIALTLNSHVDLSSRKNIRIDFDPKAISGVSTKRTDYEIKSLSDVNTGRIPVEYIMSPFFAIRDSSPDFILVFSSSILSAVNDNDLPAANVLSREYIFSLA